jgi:hypothetical protein
LAPIVRSYEEACELIRRVHILPFSTTIPGQPTLESVVLKESWHTGLETDPWLWRDRFPEEGAAAYGKFLAKKPVFIEAKLFPLIKAAFGSRYSVEERYESGMLSPASLRIYQLIEEHEGVEVKELRKLAEMMGKERKSEFDQALIELQSSFDIVMSGISERLTNEFGNKSGWNGTCYMTADHWIERHGLPERVAREEARSLVWDKLAESGWPEEAIAYLKKRWKAA